MEIGIFARTYKRPTLDGLLEAIAQDGFSTVQFNMSCIGLESLPAEIPDSVAADVREAFHRHGLSMCALSGTFNMIHPDLAERDKGIRRFEVLASKARIMGASLITLCTGTRNTQSMWKNHPDNHSKEAWEDLLTTTEKLLKIAESADVCLGIEPEPNNVIDTAERALNYISTMQDHHLQFVMDAANLFSFDDLPIMPARMRQAFEILGPYITLAHAKDITNSNPPKACAAGTGVLDYALYLDLLNQIDYQGAFVLHELTEAQIPESLAFIKSFRSDWS